MASFQKNVNLTKKLFFLLKKYNLFERVCKGYPKGIHTLEEKEEEQYKEEDKDLNFQKLYGKYNNVCLTAEQYNRLLGICASQKLLDELVDSLSENIETGKENPFRADFPNAHAIRIEKYREFRLKYPDRFKASGKVQTIQDEQAELRRMASEWAAKGGST